MSLRRPAAGGESRPRESYSTGNSSAISYRGSGVKRSYGILFDIGTLRNTMSIVWNWNRKFVQVANQQ